MKDELGGKIMTEFVALRPKTYSYLTDDGNSDKNTQGTKKWTVKRILKFNDYKHGLLDKEIILKSQQRFKSEAHDCILKKSIRLHYVVMMIKNCKLLIELHRILMVQVLEKYVKQSC